MAEKEPPKPPLPLDNVPVGDKVGETVEVDVPTPLSVNEGEEEAVEHWEADEVGEVVEVEVAEGVALGLPPMGMVLPPVFTVDPTAAHPEEVDSNAPYVPKADPTIWVVPIKVAP